MKLYSGAESVFNEEKEIYEITNKVISEEFSKKFSSRHSKIVAAHKQKLIDEKNEKERKRIEEEKLKIRLAEEKIQRKEIRKQRRVLSKYWIKIEIVGDILNEILEQSMNRP